MLGSCKLNDARMEEVVMVLIATGVLVVGCNSPLAEYESQIAKPSSVALSGIAIDVAHSAEVVTNSSDDAGAVEVELPVIGEGSSIEDCLRYAALRNKGLEAAFYSWRAAVEKSPQVTALPDPQFTYGYFINEVETRVGAQQQRFQFAQMFPWFGKLNLRGEAADAGARVAYQGYETQKTALFDRVRVAYDELFYLRRAILLTKENLALLQQFEEVAMQKYRVGKAAYSDVIRVEVEIGKIEDRVRQLNDLRGPLTARLNSALNREPGAEAPWPTDIASKILDIDDDQVLAWMRETNPELIALDEQIEQERLKSELTRLNYYPDVTIGLTYIATGEAMNPRITESSDDATLGTISFNLPIAREKYAAGVREAIARRLSKAGAKADKIDRLNAAVKQALFKHEDSQRRVELYRGTLIPKAEESLRASLTAFEGEKATFLDLIDTERSLLEFQLMFERARADRAIAISNLERLTGRSLPVRDEVSEEK